MEKNKPATEIKIGPIKATVWKNSGSKGDYHNVTFCKLYKKGDSWETTTTFSRDDLALLDTAIKQTQAWLSNRSPE